MEVTSRSKQRTTPSPNRKDARTVIPSAPNKTPNKTQNKRNAASRSRTKKRPVPATAISPMRPPATIRFPLIAHAYFQPGRPRYVMVVTHSRDIAQVHENAASLDAIWMNEFKSWTKKTTTESAEIAISCIFLRIQPETPQTPRKYRPAVCAGWFRE